MSAVWTNRHAHSSADVERGRPRAQRLPCRRTALTLALAALLLGVGRPGAAAWGQARPAADNRPLVDHYDLKFGASESTSFINVTRNSDGAKTSLVTSDYSPYVGFDTPPWFLGKSWVSVGLSTTYQQFTASRQKLSGGTRQGVASTAEVETLSIIPTASLYVGRHSRTQYLRLLVGSGIGWANVKGRVEFGNKPGAQKPENLKSPEGASPSVTQTIEYRYKHLSLAYTSGGPLIQGRRHTYQLGSDTFAISLVFGL